MEIEMLYMNKLKGKKMKTKILISALKVLLPIFLLLGFFGQSIAQNNTDLRFEIFFTEEAHPEPITGRVYIIIRENVDLGKAHGPLLWGKDVFALKPGEKVIFDENVFGFPIINIQDIPPGEYKVQGFVNVYTEYKRSDGHTLWLPSVQWESQRWQFSPGNIYSDIRVLPIESSEQGTITISCTNVIPPRELPPDTEWVKRIKFKSEILTKFCVNPCIWERPYSSQRIMNSIPI